MKINSHNEWDKLKEIIVGRAEGHAPLVFPHGLVSPELLEKSVKLARQAYPQWLVDEISEDLEGLCDVLKSFGAKVYRPDLSHNNKLFTTPYFSAVGDHVYNMRDLHLVVGDNVIESPSQEQHRYFEAMGLYPIWYEYFKAGGFKWIAGPKPRIPGNHMEVYTVQGKSQYDDGQKYTRLTEEEILFEAANTLRMGRDLLYLVSRSGNYLGAKWLQSVLGSDYRVHTTSEIYRSSHIDSTAMALRPGLVMLNATRVDSETCPAVFKKWDKIYFSDIVPTPQRTLDIHEKVRKPVHIELEKLGVKSGLGSISSPWIGMNFLSIDPNHVVVDKIQVPLMKILEQHGITPVPISFRHSYFMGGIHCSTLDTVRESKLESYGD
ncbi:MAG: hypothetical protein A3B99_04135 [Candidatus Yanofskybacteria bacterium RIFCSPHIGHO2_02_FULL_44_12b]|uniref:Inosamine-phosphate amidinotransferase 1 n=2 Tax=Candidatus Yanofskyibacteriota TaxID=1752733 RepID=A0A1F8GQP5_9BACT|nr:MAG: hypothetical protein UW79_C0019G0011 [Candidatus Yanofskybacteria bacterium GW2011_GWA2_44_9]OGN04631.1 MAG: hypothetical protein A2659_00705 [Candidatus Yanofskybacteria bacterium RIFCSPHIGHO2_01_FULL_44_24]OGN15703.1 MAG: hypothetical protein A3B99_04135 [Candidatus Yanofskybacteria bacterium RIFCSPHIGHO2_02_FULL_44_12b]OGN26759.1 MAG: hypothetical protein A2925_04220 [Candidatus Yanofskybacteria bacterium RIFCSPLOWO2_01_FULL_44_22]